MWLGCRDSFSVVREGLNGVLAAGEPGRITGAEKRADKGDEAGPNDPFGSNQNRKRRENSEKASANKVTQTDAGGNTEKAEKRGFGKQGADDEELAGAEGFEDADVVGALEDGGVHGEEDDEEADGDGESDHGVDKGLQAGDVGGGHEAHEILKWADGVVGKKLFDFRHDVLGVLGASALDEEDRGLFAGADEVLEFVCVSGELTNPWRTDYTERQLRPGDLINIDINGNSFQGYKSCYYRTFCCGKPTSEQEEVYEEARAMLYEGMSGVKAGNTTLDICERFPTDPAYWGPYKEWNEVSGHAMGHGIGLALQEKPLILLPRARANPEVLEEGMVIALETWAGKYGGKHGVRLEEQMVVTREGYDLLSLWPIDKLTRCWT